MHRYPLAMRILSGGVILSEIVKSEKQEHAYRDAGWSPKVPELPVPPDDGTAPAGESTALNAEVVSLKERVQALEDEVVDLKAKRGPGRPSKEPK